MKISLITALTALVLLVIFAAQNAEVVDIRFLFWKLSMSRAVLLLLVFVTGLGSGWLLSSLTRSR